VNGSGLESDCVEYVWSRMELSGVVWSTRSVGASSWICLESFESCADRFGDFVVSPHSFHVKGVPCPMAQATRHSSAVPPLRAIPHPRRGESFRYRCGAMEDEDDAEDNPTTSTLCLSVGGTCASGGHQTRTPQEPHYHKKQKPHQTEKGTTHSKENLSTTHDHSTATQQIGRPVGDPGSLVDML
jgi:hypothetical protein